MSSTPIPKERQSAYQRWELASLERPARHPSAAPTPASSASATAGDPLRKTREQARAEGYAAGLEEGRATGLAQGREQAAGELARIRAIAEELPAQLVHADETISDALLDLALDLAKAMLKTSLAVRPELVLPIVREAVRQLPAVQAPATLLLNPEDAAAIGPALAGEFAGSGWRIAESDQIERGGCRVETGVNDVDATASTRWQRIAAALGKESSWSS